MCYQRREERKIIAHTTTIDKVGDEGGTFITAPLNNSLQAHSHRRITKFTFPSTIYIYSTSGIEQKQVTSQRDELRQENLKLVREIDDLRTELQNSGVLKALIKCTTPFSTNHI